MTFAAIDWGSVFEVVWVSLVAGVGATTLFSLVVYGTSRASEARREGGNPTAFGLLALFGGLGFTAVVVFAITVILNKS
jgi:hypothetical protein